MVNSVSDNLTISTQPNGLDIFSPNDFRRARGEDPIRPMCVYMCRYRDLSVTVGGKLK